MNRIDKILLFIAVSLLFCLIFLFCLYFVAVHTIQDDDEDSFSHQTVKLFGLIGFQVPKSFSAKKNPFASEYNKLTAAEAEIYWDNSEEFDNDVDGSGGIDPLT